MALWEWSRRFALPSVGLAAMLVVGACAAPDGVTPDVGAGRAVGVATHLPAEGASGTPLASAEPSSETVEDVAGAVAGEDASSPEAEGVQDAPEGSEAAAVSEPGGVPPRPGRVRFAVIGDFGTGGRGAEAVADLIDARDVDFILTTGDNVYGALAIDDVVGRLYSGYIGDYSGSYGPGSATNRFFPALGNHDHSDGGGVEDYYDYFTLPGDGFASSSGSERYYDFVWGPVHVFVLDGFVDTTEQRRWLSQQMPRSEAAWQIVVLHFAPYTSSANHGSSEWMQWPYGAWGADLVMTGHNHQYERLLVDDGAGVIPYVVTGLGGQAIHPFGEPASGSVARYNGDFGAVIVTACSSGVRLQFHSMSDGVVDRMRLGDGCWLGRAGALVGE